MQAAMLVGVCGVMIGSTADAQAHSTRIYRYRDAHGVVQVSSILPPGQAQSGYEILDGASLRVLSVVIAAPTAQEPAGAAAARRAAAMAKAAAEEAEQQRREVQAQQQRDRMLLQTYASEAELLALRDQKLQTLELIRHTLDQTIAYLRANLERMDTTLAEHRTAGREPPPELLAARTRTAADLADQTRAAEHNQAEQAAIRRRFDDDLHRFRQLTQSL
jgi:hypothetical protein